VTRPDEWNAQTEEGYALAIAPLMQEIADMVKAKLPAGTDFGVLVFAPSSDPKREGRVLAATTDRTRMATYAAQWVLTVLPRGKKR
jgi:hypothetical protein